MVAAVAYQEATDLTARHRLTEATNPFAGLENLGTSVRQRVSLSYPQPAKKIRFRIDRVMGYSILLSGMLTQELIS